MDSVLLYQSNLQATSSNAQSYKSRKKKITIWKSDFSKVANSQFTRKIRIYSFFLKIFSNRWSLLHYFSIFSPLWYFHDFQHTTCNLKLYSFDFVCKPESVHLIDLKKEIIIIYWPHGKTLPTLASLLFEFQKQKPNTL